MFFPVQDSTSRLFRCKIRLSSSTSRNGKRAWLRLNLFYHFWNLKPIMESFSKVDATSKIRCGKKMAWQIHIWIKLYNINRKNNISTDLYVILQTVTTIQCLPYQRLWWFHLTFQYYFLYPPSSSFHIVSHLFYFYKPRRNNKHHSSPKCTRLRIQLFLW